MVGWTAADPRDLLYREASSSKQEGRFCPHCKSAPKHREDGRDGNVGEETSDLGLKLKEPITENQASYFIVSTRLRSRL